MKTKLHCFKISIVVMSAVLYSGFCGCSVFNSSDHNSNEKEIVSETATADRSVLTERQKKILAEKSLPTEIDKLNESQKLDIAVVEDALLYLDEKYDGVSFDFYSLRLAGIMGNQHVKFIPTGYDKDDSRNIVTVEKARNEHKYTDDYMLIPVRESMENVIKSYMEDYFGKGEVKIYLRPGSTDIEYGDVINETTIIGKVQSRAAVFLPSDICSEDKFNTFIDDCLKWTDDNDIYCGYRFTTINRENYEEISQYNYTDFYYPYYIVNDALK